MSDEKRIITPQVTQFIDLTDGTRLEIKISFATIYHMQMVDKNRLMNKKDLTDREKMVMSGNLIYAILRSNGKKVDFEEALELMPVDTKSVDTLLKAFDNQLDDYAKKKQSKTYMQNQGRNRKKH